jgi:chromosome segregation ATPase
MEVDIRLWLTVAGVFASVVAAAAIARHQIGNLTAQLNELQNAMKQFDHRLDQNDQETSKLKHRVDILANMSNPDKLEAKVRELAALGKDIEHIKEKLSKVS